ncbi:leucine dehydrogenase, partial [Candidatus Parcubacteria bacterium]
QGFFSTGEDIGISLEDVKIMLQHSHHIIGKPDEAGDLGEITAKGVLFAMRAALKEVFGSSSLEGRTVAIKGLGKVGGALAEFVAREGGKVIGAEVNEAALARARTRIPSLAVVPPQKIHRAEADIFAPCALGGDLNASTIPELRCKIVCGAANNQLASPEAGVMLHQRGILYIPDYLANAGGLINVTAELHKDGYSRERVEKKVAQIQQTAAKVIALAKRQHIPTAQAADALAEEIFLGRRNKKADT